MSKIYPFSVLFSLLLLFACNDDDDLPVVTTNFIDQGFVEIWNSETAVSSDNLHFSFLTGDYLVLPIRQDEVVPNLIYEYYQKNTGNRKGSIGLQFGFDFPGLTKRAILDNVFTVSLGNKSYHIDLNAGLATLSDLDLLSNRVPGFEEHYYWGDYSIIDNLLLINRSKIGTDNAEAIIDYDLGNEAGALSYNSVAAGRNATGEEIVYVSFKKYASDFSGPDTMVCMAFDVVNNEQLWQVKAAYEMGRTLNDWLYQSTNQIFISAADDVMAIDKQTGALLWRSDEIVNIFQTWRTAQVSDSRFVIVDNSNNVIALNTTSGAIEWQRPVSGSNFSEDLSFIDELTLNVKGDLLFGYDPGQRLIECYNLNDGTLIWQVAHPNPVDDWANQLTFVVDPVENLLYINNGREIMAVRYPE